MAGSDNFYRKISRVFEEAKRNAPALVFIDDADVIFEDKDEHGFYRYLLTMLDGLESASAERVCVMMTAMDVGHLPPALIRSGRIELWLVHLRGRVYTAESQLPRSFISLRSREFIDDGLRHYRWGFL